MTILNEQELLTNIATNATEIAITGAWNKVKKFFKDLDAKDSIRYRTAYENKKTAKLKPLYPDVSLKIYIHYMFV